ncbi:MAG: hypothetical protein AABX28_00920 [Nanoarchaeota archaeon]
MENVKYWLKEGVKLLGDALVIYGFVTIPLFAGEFYHIKSRDVSPRESIYLLGKMGKVLTPLEKIALAGTFLSHELNVAWYKPVKSEETISGKMIF